MMETRTVSSEDFDSEFNEDIVCPYCGYHFPDSDNYDLEDGEQACMECYDCGRRFGVIAEVEKTYCGIKFGEDEDADNK